MATDELDDVTQAALQLLYEREQAARRRAGPPCPRCGRRAVAPGESFCRSCAAEAREQELETKRDWWERRGARAATKLERAQTWLKSQLRRGPVDSQVIRQRADAAHIYPRTLRRAREQLQVDVERRADGRTFWSL